MIPNIDPKDFDVSVLKFPLVNGGVLTAERKDPYGYYYFKLDAGKIPEEFQGAYTTIQAVEQAVQQYSIKRDIPLGPQPPRPEIKYKQPKA